MLDETALVDELRRVETDLNALEASDPGAADPQRQATRYQRHARRAQLLKAIHAAEVHRLEATGLIPWGCNGCPACTAHGLNGFQRLGDLQKGVRWNAAAQAWERRTWRAATDEEIAAYEAGPDSPAPPLERYRAWRKCWTGTDYGADPPAPEVRWNRRASQYEVELWT